MEAAADSFSPDSRSAGLTVSYTPGSGIGSVGGRFSMSDAEGVTYTNAGLFAGGALNITTGGDASLIGANLHGDSVSMAIAGRLRLESLQNRFERNSLNASATVGLGDSGSPSSLSGSFGMSWADRGWVDDMAAITSAGALDIRVDGETDLIGGLINSDTGELRLETAALNWTDIEDRDRTGGFNVGISGIGLGGLFGGEGESSDTAGEEGEDGKEGEGQNQGMGSIGSLSFAWESTNKEGVTRATVGDGVIVAPNDISALNRAIEKAQEITRDEGTKVRVVIPLPDADARRTIGNALDAVGAAIADAFADDPVMVERVDKAQEAQRRIAENTAQALKDKGYDEAAAQAAADALASDEDVIRAAVVQDEMSAAAEHFGGQENVPLAFEEAILDGGSFALDENGLPTVTDGRPYPAVKMGEDGKVYALLYDPAAVRLGAQDDSPIWSTPLGPLPADPNGDGASDAVIGDVLRDYGTDGSGPATTPQMSLADRLTSDDQAIRVAAKKELLANGVAGAIIASGVHAAMTGNFWGGVAGVGGGAALWLAIQDNPALQSAVVEATHVVLGVAGMFPILGEPADWVSGGMSAFTEDYWGAVLSGGSSVPGLGWIPGAAKIGRALDRIADAAGSLPDGYRAFDSTVGAAANVSGGLPDGYRRVVNNRTDDIEILGPDGKV